MCLSAMPKALGFSDQTRAIFLISSAQRSISGTKAHTLTRIIERMSLSEQKEFFSCLPRQLQL